MSNIPMNTSERKSKVRILLVELEFPTWNKARSWSYAAQLGYEEGLIRHGASFMTLPAYWGVDPSSTHSWLRHARHLCRGQHFDQVWVEVVHSPLDYAFLEWLTGIAPVRVGFIPESLEYEPDVYAFAPYLRTRKAEVEKRLAFMTHAVAADEADVEALNASGLVHALWWPAAVPQRCIGEGFTRSKNDFAVFYGELYGERTQWLARKDLDGLLVRPPAPEIGTPYPKRFDELHRVIRGRLGSGKMVQERDLNDYLMQLRRIRQESFDLWLRGLTPSLAVVNLPHFLRAYAGRVVEAMAAGVPVISWEIPDRPRNRDLFADGEDILLFSRDDPAQLAQHILRLRKQPDLAEHLATSAREKVREYHTIEKRTQDILAWIEETAERPSDEQEEADRGLWAAGAPENGAASRPLGETRPEMPDLIVSVDAPTLSDMPPALSASGTGGFVARNAPVLAPSPQPAGVRAVPTRLPQVPVSPKDGDATAALQHYLEAIRENPENVDAWVAVGQFAMEMDDLPTARTAFRKANLLDPSRQDVRQALQRLNDPPGAPMSDMDRYYTRLFGHDPEWSKPQPNQDEAARWAKIVVFLRQIAQAEGAEGNLTLRILDLGCGRGWLTNLASEYGVCEGIDPVANVIEMGRRHFPGLRFYAGTARTLRERDDFEPYDVVISSEVIEHIPDAEKNGFVDDILALLKPNGYVILTTPRREALERWRQVSNPAQPVEDWMREKDLRRLMTKKEFRVMGHDRVYQDLTTRRFIPEAVPDGAVSSALLALYQVWAFQAQGVGRGLEPLFQPATEPDTPAVLSDARPVSSPAAPAGPHPMRHPAPKQRSSVREFRVIALIAAYNEGDVIYHVIGDLIENGVKVYLIDNNSTDDTVEEARRWLGKGLLHIERFPQDCGYPERNEREYVWRDILRRKEELAGHLRADWFIHADADEFRESPWPDLSLSEAIHYVDGLGYNAIQFELLNFRPIDDHFIPGTDVRTHMLHYEPGELFNAMQIKAWKQTDLPVSLAQHGGHAVMFQGRRVCPVPFLLRHYPIRGETHGRRKVFQDRLPRFAQEERAMQWHVQYDDLIQGKARFLHDPADLIKYDPAAVRASILSQVMRDMMLMETLHGTANTLTDTTLDGGAVCTWVTNMLNELQPVRLSVAVQANETLDRLLQTPLDKQGGGEPHIAYDQITIVQAMAQIKKAQARLHGNSLTVKRLEAFCRALDQRVQERFADTP